MQRIIEPYTPNNQGIINCSGTGDGYGFGTGNGSGDEYGFIVLRGN